MKVELLLVIGWILFRESEERILFTLIIEECRDKLVYKINKIGVLHGRF